MANEININEFTKEDFYKSLVPYENIKKQENELIRKQVYYLTVDHAKNIGVDINRFKDMYKAYETLGEKKEDEVDYPTICLDGITKLYVPSKYYMNGEEIWLRENGKHKKVCSHQIQPGVIIENFDTGIEKMGIIFKKRGRVRIVVKDKKVLASSRDIISLADNGIDVTSENAKDLIEYLREMEYTNKKELPTKYSVGRVGWIGEDFKNFSPFSKHFEFDGNEQFRKLFKGIKPKGSLKEWIKEVKRCRKYSLMTKIALAASFASILIAPIGALPFFLHLWGGTGNGKTVALMIAASVWANPAQGAYIQSFNSTGVGQEQLAVFFNSLPLCLDELQINKDKKDFDRLIYTLTEGVERIRGQKSGGLRDSGTWRNCIITTGEMPISNAQSGGGAINRVIEVDCKDIKSTDDFDRTLSIIKENYGLAGKKFLEEIQKEDSKINFEFIKDMYLYNKEILSGKDITLKQIISASLILTADRLIEMIFFKDKNVLSVDEILPFLSTTKEVSTEERAYNYLFDTIAANAFKFDCDVVERWGSYDEMYIYIIRSKFNEIVENGGFNPQSLLSYLDRSNKLVRAKGKMTLPKRINGIVARCVCIKNINGLKDENEEIETPK